MYVHGHSAGGTNPVLVESMWAGLPTACFDVNFHRYTTENQAFYFKTSDELERLTKSISQQSLNSCGEALRRIAEIKYTWHSVLSAYEKIVVAGHKQ
jgi:glycosyltransferase involved in cell wall biosynthesis